MPPSTPNTRPLSSDTHHPLWVSALLAAAFWLVGFWELHFEWAINEQYNYGFFVPFLALYLLYLRWEDKPALGTPSPLPLGFALSVGTLLTYAVALFFLGNIDWRPLHFTQAFVAASISLLLLYKIGGWRWVCHFGFPVLFIWIALPWPRFAEKLLINGLMDTVAFATVDFLNICGIYANQQGSVIMLGSGAVNVAEACSGVRSFQSTLMGGLFLGELFRIQWGLRGVLIILSCGCALLFNVLRTLGLTYIANIKGPEVLGEWHDPAGYFVFAASFSLLFCFALFFKRFAKVVKPEHATSSISTDGISKTLAYPFILLVALALPCAYGWYAYRSKDVQLQPLWTLNWQAGAPDVKLKPLDQAVLGVLMCDESTKAEWESFDGGSWVAYYMQWNSAETGQIGGLHSPGNCLPAVGWQLLEKGHPIPWEKDGVRLIICPFAFTLHDEHIFVFDVQWDPSGYDYSATDGLRRYKDRFLDVWQGNRKNHKRTLEFVGQEYMSMKQATETFLAFLDKALVVDTPSPKED